jgi:hypothetical protein
MGVATTFKGVALLLVVVWLVSLVSDSRFRLDLFGSLPRSFSDRVSLLPVVLEREVEADRAIPGLK